MFIFFFYLATFLLDNKFENKANLNHQLIKEDPIQITNVSIEGTLKIGETITAKLQPNEADSATSGITYKWEYEITSEEAESSELLPELSSDGGVIPPGPGVSSEGENPPADSSEGGNPPVDSSEGGNPPADSSEGENPPADSSEGENPPADSSEGENPPADSSEGENPPADSSEGENPPADSSEGENPPADSSEGENPPADSSEGENPPADSSEGENPPADSSEGDGAAHLLESVTYKPIPGCSSKTCTIPNDAPVGSRIRVTVTGEGNFTGTVNVTSDSVILAADPEVGSSSDEEKPGESSLPAEPTSDTPADACLSIAKCNKCDQKDPKLCAACDSGYALSTDKLSCTLIEDFCQKNIPNCRKCSETDPSKCDECKGDFVLNEEKTQCITRSNNCDEVVLYCTKCEIDRPTFCTNCFEGYGLKNGVCTLCGEGKFVNSQAECLPECSSIPHCEKCHQGTSRIVCDDCEDNYTLNEDSSACVSVRDLPSDFCKTDNDGCAECNKENPMWCTKCNTGYTHYNDKYCICNGYSINGRCYNETELKCDETVENCESCLNSNQCIYCKDNFDLMNGKCIPYECKIENCKQCYVADNQYYCDRCDEDNGYYASSDDKTCIKYEEVDCSVIAGCTKCSNIDNRCVKCNTELGFKEDVERDYDDHIDMCVCNSSLELVDGLCLPLILPMTPEPGAPRIEIEPDMYTHPSENPNEIQITGSTKNATAIYSMDVDKTLESIAVSDNITNILFKIEGTDKPLTINPLSETTEVILDFTDDSKIVIPPKSDNIEIKGTGKINIEPIKKEGSDTPSKEITINKVSPKPNGNMEFESDVDNLIIKEIQTFGTSTIKGDSRQGKTTTCQDLLLEGGSDFSTYDIVLQKVKIGLKSILNLNTDTTKFDEGSKLWIYYNRTIPERRFPIKINNAFPDFDKVRISVHNIASGDYLPVEQADEQLLIAQFNNENAGQDKLWEECQKLRPKFEDGNNFENAQCLNITEKEVNLVATKVDKPSKSKDKKLSGGAIAGIVIACIVVVAAIIALLVYFLVIKKKNQSTTSTQGDSSIAI